MSVKAEAEAAGVTRQTIYNRKEKIARKRRYEAVQLYGRIWAIAEASEGNQLSAGLYSNYLQQPGIYMGQVLRLAPNVDKNVMAEVMNYLTPDDLKIGKLTADEQTALVLSEYHEKGKKY